MSWLTDVFIAHRGLHSGDSNTPENSLKSYYKAIQSGYAIELDVRLSLDNQLIVFHDDDLNRMCNIEGKVNTFNLSDLQNITLLRSDEKVPSLKEVFNLVAGKVPILIEIKSENAKAGIIEPLLLNEINSYKGDVAIQSFNPLSIRWFKKYAPEIIRGQLASSFDDEKISPILKYALKNMLFNMISKPHFIAYEKKDICKEHLQKIRNKGKILICWTVKNSTEKDQVAPYCDNIIFEGFIPNNI